MLRQDWVTLKEDTILHTHIRAHAHTHTHTCERPCAETEGEFYFQEVFCAYLCGETIAREGGQEQKEGPDCVSERVRAPGVGVVEADGSAQRKGGWGVSYIGLEPSCVLERGCG